MMRAMVLLTAILAMPLSLHSQPPGAASGGPPSKRGPVASAPASQQQLTDIEVMRRLLDGEMRTLYSQATSTLTAGFEGHQALGVRQWAPRRNDPLGCPGVDGWVALWPTTDQDPHGQHVLHAAEGTYLAGYGVVYSITLPQPMSERKSEPQPPARKPLTAWEKTQKEVRGERVEPEPVVARQPSSVSGTILKLLAENGKHLSWLKDDERITVAVTYRTGLSMASAACTKCHVASGAGGGAGLGSSGAGSMGAGVGGASISPPGGGAGSGPGLGGSSGGGAGLHGIPGGLGTGGGAGGLAGTGGGATLPGGPGVGGGSAGGGLLGPGGGLGDSSSARPWETRLLLADLHMKQGRVQEAISEYVKASEALEAHMGRTWNWDAGQLHAAQTVYGKLIAAYLATGDRTKVRAVLDKLEKVPAPPSTLAGGGADGGLPARASSSLPGKLIVSVTKRTLDHVGNGSINMEALRKAATIEETPTGGGR